MASFDFVKGRWRTWTTPCRPAAPSTPVAWSNPHPAISRRTPPPPTRPWTLFCPCTQRPVESRRVSKKQWQGGTVRLSACSCLDCIKTSHLYVRATPCPPLFVLRRPCGLGIGLQLQSALKALRLMAVFGTGCTTSSSDGSTCIFIMSSMIRESLNSTLLLSGAIYFHNPWHLLPLIWAGGRQNFSNVPAPSPWSRLQVSRLII